MLRKLTPVFTLLMCCGLFVTSCRKKNDHTDVTFVNQVNKIITLDIYSSAADYNMGTNRLIRKALQPNEVLVMSKDLLASGKTYYADWYDDDHYYNNWFNELYMPKEAFTVFKPVPGSNTYYLKNSFKGKAAISFLNNDTATRWKAMDVFVGNHNIGYTSIWSQLQDYEKYREVVIHRNFIADYSYKNVSGSIVTQQYNINVHNTEDAYIEFMNTAEVSDGYMQGGFLPTSTQPNYTSSSIDTVMGLLPASDYTFMMVRQ